MNEDRIKVYIGPNGAKKMEWYKYQSCWVKPTGKFWKRYFNKKVRRGGEYKKQNWWEWS